jgi:hypothetical protein
VDPVLDVCLYDAIVDHLAAVEAVERVEPGEAKCGAIDVVVIGKLLLLAVAQTI